MFKNVLGTCETEILKIVKNIQHQPKNVDVLIKESVSQIYIYLLIVNYESWGRRHQQTKNGMASAGQP